MFQTQRKMRYYTNLFGEEVIKVRPDEAWKIYFYSEKFQNRLEKHVLNYSDEEMEKIKKDEKAFWNDKFLMPGFDQINKRTVEIETSILQHSNGLLRRDMDRAWDERMAKEKMEVKA